jgi:hypothetical protein
MSAISLSISKLRELAPALNKACDDAAKIVQEIEDLLNKELNLGIQATVSVSSTDVTPERTEVIRLAHRRVKGRFRIAVVQATHLTYVDESQTLSEPWEEHEVTPWAECARDVKLETFARLPQLLEKIIKNAETAHAAVEKAKSAVQAFLGHTTDALLSATAAGDASAAKKRPVLAKDGAPDPENVFGSASC